MIGPSEKIAREWTKARQLDARTSTRGEIPTERFFSREETGSLRLLRYAPPYTVVKLSRRYTYECIPIEVLGRTLVTRIAEGTTESFDEVIEAVQPVPSPNDTDAVAAPIAELTRTMRDMVDLPVQDLARLCGVQRRTFYTWLRGQARPAAAQEARVRALHKSIAQLFGLLDGDAAAVRSAVLTPLPGGLESLYDLAQRSSDLATLSQGLKSLSALIAAQGPPAQRLPPSGTLPADAPEWADADGAVGSRGSEE